MFGRMTALLSIISCVALACTHIQMQNLLVTHQNELTNDVVKVRIFEMSTMSSVRRADPRTLVYVNLSLITIVACVSNSNKGVSTCLKALHA